MLLDFVSKGGVRVNEVIRFSYPTKISDIVEANQSFDKCVIRICYEGKNRNGSILPREAIEEALPSMAYCPIVTNYSIEDDSFGGHDCEIVNRDGHYKMINMTDAIGVIPANPECFWETVDDHEYLCCNALLWKRSAAYSKLKQDGGAAQSMEIHVEAGHVEDDSFVVEKFSFLAFCVIGLEPCFENAEVHFSLNETSVAEMLNDFKQAFACVGDACENTIISEGRNIQVKFEEMLAKYGLTETDVDFDVESLSEDELESRLAECAKKKAEFADDEQESDDPQDAGNDDEGEGSGDDEETPVEDDGDDDTVTPKQYALSAKQMTQEMYRELGRVKYNDQYGEWGRYYYVDHDDAVVYYLDEAEGNKLFGAPYTVQGDAVVIDFAATKRKKIQYADFEADEAMDVAQFSMLTTAMQSQHEQISELAQFKAEVMADRAKTEVEGVFDAFSDLNGVEMFEAYKASVRENYCQYTKDMIEEKCYAIRGRTATLKFSVDESPKPVRTLVDLDPSSGTDDPYNGLFAKYGIN